MVSTFQSDRAIKSLSSYAGRRGRLPSNAPIERKLDELSAGIALLARTMIDVVIRHQRFGPDWEGALNVRAEDALPLTDPNNPGKIRLAHSLNYIPNQYVVIRSSNNKPDTFAPPSSGWGDVRVLEFTDRDMLLQFDEPALTNQREFRLVPFRGTLVPLDADRLDDSGLETGI